MGQWTHNSHPTSKSPNSKIGVPVGVEPRGLQMLSSKSTSKSPRKKAKTMMLSQLATEKTEEVHFPMMTVKRSTEISRK